MGKTARYGIIRDSTLSHSAFPLFNELPGRTGIVSAWHIGLFFVRPVRAAPYLEWTLVQRTEKRTVSPGQNIFCRN